MKKTLALISLFIFILSSTAFSGALLTYPKFQAWTNAGKMLTNGKLYTYYPGTTTKKTSYTDVDLATPASNPIILNARGEAEIYLQGGYKLVLKGSDNSTIWTQDNVFGRGIGGKGVESICTYGDTLSVILTAIGSDNATVSLDCDVIVDSNATIASNINVVTMLPGRFLCDATTRHITFNGNFSGDLNKVFYGCGTPHINHALEIYPEWWGSINDGTSDDSVAVQAAIDSAPVAGGKVKLSNKDWTFNASVNQTSIWIEGSWVGPQGLVTNVLQLASWRPFDKTLPILHVYSDRYYNTIYPTGTSVRLTNFFMEAGNYPGVSNASLAGRGQKGLHLDQGSRGVVVDHFSMQGFTEYAVRIGKPDTHEITDINFSNFIIGMISGGSGYGGLGDGVKCEYGDAPLGPTNWTTSVNFTDGMFVQWSAPIAWDNGTIYYNDTTHGTSTVVEVPDEPSDNGTWGYIHVCTVAGTSKTGGQPSWNHTIGETTTDGTVTWTTYDRGRTLNLIGCAGTALINVGTEAGHYGGVRLRKDPAPYGSTVFMMNSSLSSETSFDSVIVENEQDAYPISDSVKGDVLFWLGSYKPKDKPKYNPSYREGTINGQSWHLTSFNSFQSYFPTFFGGFVLHDYSDPYNPATVKHSELFKDRTHETMLQADDNITLKTPYKIKFDSASVELPDTARIWNIVETLSSDTFIANTTVQREIVSLYAPTATTLTNIILETDANKIEDWNGTWSSIGHYETFSSTGPDIDSAIETGSYGDAMTHFFSVTAGKNYSIVATVTLNSGEEPYLYVYSGDATHIESGFPVRLYNGVNTLSYTAGYSGISSYLFVKNLSASNWSATFTLHEHKLGIEKILSAGDDNLTIAHDPTKISLKGGIDLPLATGDMIGLLSVGGIWKETFRNVAAEGTWTVPLKVGINYLWSDTGGTIRKNTVFPIAHDNGTTIE
jgi:hypothetical protein